MNAFDRKISGNNDYPLSAETVSTLQANMGYRCNLRCTHCHINASPDRTEEMSSDNVSKVIKILREHDEITTLDITGGSPELNRNFRRLVKAAAEMGKNVLVRSNLAIYSEPGMESIPKFLAENKVKIIASLPCYTEEGVDGQRGKGTYKKAVEALKKLNSMGYGIEDTGLEIDIMFNPESAEIAPDQNMLEKAYKEKLKEMHGVTFNHLTALSNMPIGRLGSRLSDEEKQNYIHELKKHYNPATVRNVMCRHLVSVSPDGSIYDCDFWQALKLSVKSREAGDLDSFDFDVLSRREILTGPLCFMCTAGAGASCGGALT
jgi:radical SAM/Cys-rich protein